MKALAVLLLLASLLVAGCANSADTGVRYVPEVAGVVVARTPTGPDWSYTLENGQTVTVPNREFIDGLQVDVGQLLLTGSSPKPWAYRVLLANHSPPDSRWPPVCYQLIVGPGRVGDTWVETELNLHTDPPAVLRVPKAPTFTAERELNDGRLQPGDGLCLDASGQAIKLMLLRG
jgi:hypothetical protein